MKIEEIKQKLDLLRRYELLTGIRDAYKSGIAFLEECPDAVINEDTGISAEGEQTALGVFGSYPIAAKWLLAGFAEAIQRLDLEIDKVKKEIESE